MVFLAIRMMLVNIILYFFKIFFYTLTLTMTYLIKTAAKLNLSLLVYQPRQDGYHPLCSVFQAISLFDELYIQIHKNQKGFTLECSHSAVPLDQTNVLYKIYQFFAADLPDGMHLKLVKNIPIGAGLGGGSSNAAGFLQFLNSYFKLGLSYSKQLALARKVGADVPFFLGKSPALVRGIGERIRPVLMGKYRYFVLINPAVFCATKEIYTAFDKALKQPKKPTKTPDFILSNHIGPNDLKPVVFQLYPQMAQLEAAILDLGCSPVMMSGSGSTLFIPFIELSQAQKYFHILKTHFPRLWIYLAEGIDTAIEVIQKE